MYTRGSRFIELRLSQTPIPYFPPHNEIYDIQSSIQTSLQLKVTNVKNEIYKLKSEKCEQKGWWKTNN